MIRPYFPNFQRGIAGLPAKRLRELASKVGVATKPKDEPAHIAEQLCRKLGTPGEAARYLEVADLEPIGLALGLGPRDKWKTKLSVAEFERLPFYNKPSYDGDVKAALELAQPLSNPKPRKPVKARANKWPELATIAKWQKADRRAVAKALAKATRGFTAALTGELELPRLRHKALGIDFIAIPGGTFTMGLSPKELREIDALVDNDETLDHVESLKRQARPSHEVAVAPFLLAATPLTRAQLDKLDTQVIEEMSAGVARVTGPEAARACAHASARLPSEAEWEYVARAGGSRTWLSGDEAPRAWAERVADGETELHRFEIAGLGWGEWVDDGWHDNYKSAPKVSAAWAPAEWPELRRGGALAIWPWTGVGGEIVLCHAAARDRTLDGLACVRLAIDLPARTPA